MQQRRPYSNIAIDGGDDSSSREQRRLERRMAKERRGGAVKKLKRVKRNNKYARKSLLGRLKYDPYFQLAIFAFGLFSLCGMTVFRMFHGSGGDGGVVVDSDSDSYSGGGERSLGSEAAPKHNTNNKASEYNSDNADGSLLSKLRGGYKYIIPDSMRRIGNKAKWYGELRREYDTEVLPKDDERSVTYVEAERKRQGQYTQVEQTPYDVYNCPDEPPEDYPIQWPVLDVLHHWPTDVTSPKKQKGGEYEIYQGICVFDYRTEYDKAEKYREKEVPFVMRNDPAVARTSERWNYPGYMEKLLMGHEDTMRRTEFSPNNHFMYWVDKRSKQQRRAAYKNLRDARKNGADDAHAGFGRGDQVEMKEAMHVIEELNELKRKLQQATDYANKHEDDDEAQHEVKSLTRLVNQAKNKKNEEASENWQPPTENIRMTYVDWLKHANVTDDQLGPDNPHWYFRLIGCGAMGPNTEDGSCDKGSSEWLFDELTFFQPRSGENRPFYLIEPKQQKGIHCRFGMKGVIAENHFDLSRNAIALMSGQRRYILSHPGQCKNMNLLPRGHPSARHSAVDWSNPNLENFPTFEDATVNEIVMQPGDVLYLPTNWFHYIVSLELNMQCNTRSGGERINRQYVTDCGF